MIIKSMCRGVAGCVLALCAVMLTGCSGGTSIAPFHTEATTVATDEIVGVWRQLTEDDVGEDGSQPERWKAPPGSKETYTISPVRAGVYRLTGAKEAPFDLEITTFKIGTDRFMNVSLSEAAQLKAMKDHGGFVVPTNMVARFELDGDRLKVVGPMPELKFTFGGPADNSPVGLAKHASSVELSLPSETPGARWSHRVLTDSTENLQRALVKSRAEGLFDLRSGLVLKRVTGDEDASKKPAPTP